MSQSSTASDRHVDVALSTIDKMSEYIRTGHQEIMEVGCDLLENKGMVYLDAFQVLD